MISASQLLQYVIAPVLTDIGMDSPAARRLLLMTAAAESGGGKYLHQLGKGPAVGIFEMEPATHDDCWANWLNYKPEIAAKVRGWQIPGVYDDNAKEMAGNLYYATAMCRVKYRRVSAPLPSYSDITGLAEYHKTYYNAGGAAEVARTVDLYRSYMA